MCQFCSVYSEQLYLLKNNFSQFFKNTSKNIDANSHLFLIRSCVKSSMLLFGYRYIGRSYTMNTKLPENPVMYRHKMQTWRLYTKQHKYRRTLTLHSRNFRVVLPRIWSRFIRQVWFFSVNRKFAEQYGISRVDIIVSFCQLFISDQDWEMITDIQLSTDFPFKG